MNPDHARQAAAALARETGASDPLTIPSAATLIRQHALIPLLAWVCSKGFAPNPEHRECVSLVEVQAELSRLRSMGEKEDNPMSDKLRPMTDVEKREFMRREHSVSRMAEARMSHDDEVVRVLEDQRDSAMTAAKELADEVSRLQAQRENLADEVARLKQAPGADWKGLAKVVLLDRDELRAEVARLREAWALRLAALAVLAEGRNGSREQTASRRQALADLDRADALARLEMGR